MGDLLREAQEAGLFDGPLSSCETELQELLRQIDIMMTNKQQEWETEKEALTLRCQAAEHQMRLHQDASHRKASQLQQHIDSMTTGQRQLVTDYEKQLSQLRSQLSDLQRDYEKVQKRHSKQTSNAEKARDQTFAELHQIERDRDDLAEQLQDTKQQLMEYKNKMDELGVHRRSHRQQTEALESQRATLAEKCQLLQEQSLGYQEQLTKRRQMLEQTELNYKSRLAHLEGQLSRAQDALDAKSTTIQSLEDRLINANSGQVRVEEESNRQLQTLERTNRDLEEQLSHLHVELQSHDDLVTATEQDMRRLQESLSAKDDVIRHLEETKQSGELVEQLRQQVSELEEEAFQLHQNERHWKDEVQRLQSRLDDSHIECANLNSELAQRIGELRHMESTELRQLAEDLIKTRHQQQEVEDHHQAVMDGMKKEISALTSDLHDRDVSMATMNSQMSALQRQLSNAIQHKERQEAELKLANTELEALQFEHHNLQEVRALDVSSTSRDLQQAEIQLQELQQLHQQHVQSSKTLEVENDNLRRELSSVRIQLQTARQSPPSSKTSLQSPPSSKTSLNGHYSADTILSPSVNKDRKLQDMESQHRKDINRLQERLDSTVKRYETELGRLHGEQERLRTNLRDKAHTIKRLQAQNNALGGFVNSAETIARSPPSKCVNSSFSNQSLSSLETRSPGSRSDGSISRESRSTMKSPASRQLFGPSGREETAPLLRESHSFPELFLSPARSLLDREFYLLQRPGSRASITAHFVEEDKRRRQELEQLLDSRLNDLEQRTTQTLQRHVHKDMELEHS